MTRIFAVVVLSLAAATQAWAQQYPTRPIRLIVPAAPGGGTDITARSFVPALQDNLGQPVVIENRGGAGGVIGTDAVAKAAPDGYTLLMIYASHATNVTLVTKLPYDTLRDFTPITLISHEPTVLVTHPSHPAKTLGEFIAWAKERSGTISYATDPGSAGFLAGELFLQKAGLKVQYIPYKGSGPAAADVVAGHVPYMWSVISIVTPYAKGGRLKPLAIAAEQRAAALPDVPTTAEGGMADFTVSGWYGLVAPAKTPKSVIDRVHAEAAKALKNEAVLQRLATSGSLPIGAGPDELDKHIRSEIVRWNKVLTAAGVQPTN
ncbi:MAG: tripartite tricarboxylate transporter substrate binding protein [Betaproteobacteria bacterium]|nr:MAG: tripartite tricarboxylate transporter substrate binding protein [Betaproteobacteria bacterium]